MSEETPELRVVLMTAPDGSEAARLARALVDEGLAACVNLVPGIRSIYRFEGEVHDEGEVLMIAKTRADRFQALCRRVAALHPYRVPEIVGLAVPEVAEAYAAWVSGECSR